MKIKGYKITVGKDCDYKISELPEEVCKPLCKVIDNGQGYAPDCRYIYSTKFSSAFSLVKGGGGIPYGSARAAVGGSAMQHPDWEKGLKISITKL